MFSSEMILALFKTEHVDLSTISVNLRPVQKNAPGGDPGAQGSSEALWGEPRFISSQSKTQD